MMPTTNTRNYDAVLAKLVPRGSLEERMQAVVDALWEQLHERNVSWVGFYLKSHHSDELELGPRRDKPACSPISLHGACGRSYLSGRPLIVTDVVNLRAGYIACDPRDRSEVVLPLRHDAQTVVGVLDLDSFDVHAFTREDVLGLQRVLEHMGLTIPSFAEIETV
jgi:putative methionine-R-sulfoxide reductase with GAF domain